MLWGLSASVLISVGAVCSCVTYQDLIFTVSQSLHRTSGPRVSLALVLACDSPFCAGVCNSACVVFHSTVSDNLIMIKDNSLLALSVGKGNLGSKQEYPGSWVLLTEESPTFILECGKKKSQTQYLKKQTVGLLEERVGTSIVCVMNFFSPDFHWPAPRRQFEKD